MWLDINTCLHALIMKRVNSQDPVTMIYRKKPEFAKNS